MISRIFCIMFAKIFTISMVICVTIVPTVQSSEYFMGTQGDSCAATCGALGLSCEPTFPSNGTYAIMQSLGITCKKDPRPWWAPNQPCLVSDSTDPNYGDCLGTTGIPTVVSCQASFWSVRRLCHCVTDVTGDPFFGTGLSNGYVSENETTIFAHKVISGNFAAMTHFWTTATEETLSDTIIRYYFDGEVTPSVEFVPGIATGVGFNDDQAPWGTKWFGVGAGNGHGTAYFLNFKMPFQKSVKITVQRPSGHRGGFYMIVRGSLGVPVYIGDILLPETARLILQKQNKTLEPLDFLAITDIPSGRGLHFMSTLVVSSGNLNFLEGCYHAYTPYNRTFPGIVLSTGTEDYFDSGWYFNAGKFRFPVSGFTHINTTKGVTFSAYRFHEMDPLQFYDGIRIEWRNGDMDDPATGLKCYTQSGGKVVGNPTASHVTTYSWVYVW